MASFTSARYCSLSFLVAAGKSAWLSEPAHVVLDGLMLVDSARSIVALWPARCARRARWVLRWAITRPMCRCRSSARTHGKM